MDAAEFAARQQRADFANRRARVEAMDAPSPEDEEYERKFDALKRQAIDQGQKEKQIAALREEYGRTEEDNLKDWGKRSAVERGGEVAARRIVGLPRAIGNRLDNFVGTDFIDDDVTAEKKAEYEKYKDEAGTAGTVGEFMGEMLATAPLSVIGTAAKGIQGGSRLTKALTSTPAAMAAEGATAGALLAEEGSGVRDALLGAGIGGALGGTGSVLKHAVKAVREGPVKYKDSTKRMSALIKEQLGKDADMGIFGSTRNNPGSVLAKTLLSMRSKYDHMLGRGAVKTQLENQREGARKMAREAILRKTLNDPLVGHKPKIGASRGEQQDAALAATQKLARDTDVQATGDLKDYAGQWLDDMLPQEKPHIQTASTPDYGHGYLGRTKMDTYKPPGHGLTPLAQSNPPQTLDDQLRLLFPDEEVAYHTARDAQAGQGQFTPAELRRRIDDVNDVAEELGPPARGTSERLKNLSRDFYESLDKRGYVGKNVQREYPGTPSYDPEMMGMLEASPQFHRWLTGTSGRQQKWQAAKEAGDYEYLGKAARAFSRTLAGQGAD